MQEAHSNADARRLYMAVNGHLEYVLAHALLPREWKVWEERRPMKYQLEKPEVGSRRSGDGPAARKVES